MTEKKLKNKKYDEDGNLIYARGNGYYLAETPFGDKVKIYTKPPIKYSRGVTTKLNANRKLQEEQNRVADKQKLLETLSVVEIEDPTGFEIQQLQERKNTKQYGKWVRKLKEESLKNGTYWKYNQRECLKTLLAMNAPMLYAHVVKWKQMTIDQILTHYEYVVTQDELDLLDDTPPTMTQLVCLTMVLKAQSDGKFGMAILEMLEGKAVSQVQIEEKIKETKRLEKTEIVTEIDETLTALRNIIFNDQEEVVEKTGEDLLNSL